MNVGANIKRLRKGRGMTARKLAKAAGLSSVDMIERRGSGSLASLSAIAKALGVTVADLTAEAPTPKRRRAG